MKNNTIWKNLSHIREEFIEEASPEHMGELKKESARKKRIRNRLISWGSLAACLTIILGATFPLWKQATHLSTEDDTYAHYPVRSWDGYVTKNEAAMRIFTFQYPASGESCQFDFPHIQWNDQTYGLSHDNHSFVQVPAEQIGEVLWETEITVYCINDYEISATLSATLSAYTGIDPAYGVVLTMEGVEGAFLYRSGKYADSMDELIEKVGFSQHLTVAKNIFHTTKNSRGEEVSLVFEGMTPEILWNELLSHGKTVDYNGEDSDYLRISIGHDLLQYNSILCVTSDGYITFSALKAGKALYVGKERVRNFLNYLENNLDGYRLVYESESNQGYAEDAIPETVTMTSAAEPHKPNPQ